MPEDRRSLLHVAAARAVRAEARQLTVIDAGQRHDAALELADGAARLAGLSVAQVTCTQGMTGKELHDAVTGMLPAASGALWSMAAQEAGLIAYTGREDLTGPVPPFAVLVARAHLLPNRTLEDWLRATKLATSTLRAPLLTVCTVVDRDRFCARAGRVYPDAPMMWQTAALPASDLA